MIEFTFPVSPVAASRPRVGRHGSYYTGAYKRFREEATKVANRILKNFNPLEGELNVDIKCYCTRPKSTKLAYPRSDADNLAKAVMDIMNKKLWVDDSQIIGMYVSKEWAPPEKEGYFIVAVDKA
jgi:Holliday junction resolvase RusA-like endonuclease